MAADLPEKKGPPAVEADLDEVNITEDDSVEINDRNTQPAPTPTIIAEPTPTRKQRARKGRSLSRSRQYENYGNKPIKMYHPNAKKGLTRITSDRKYIYKTPTSPQEGASSLRFGLYKPSNLTNASGTVRFSEIYDEAEAPILLFEYEWQLWTKFGKLGLQAGTGLFVASGHGKLGTTSYPSRENFTFIAFPTTANIIYRLQYWDGQWLVPFVSAGAGLMAFTEIRDDKNSPKLGGSLLAQASGGGALSLNAISSEAALEMDREYGINNAWFLVEFRVMQSLGDKFDFSSNFVNAGMLLEF